MKKSKTATTIAEAMVVIVVIVIWLTWVYKIYSESMKLSNSVETKIQAIQIAREWIEAITNIRDTNWLLYSSDKRNCWKTFNYDASCIWNTSFTNNIVNNWNYRISRDTNNRWTLGSDVSAWDDFSTSAYKNFYKIYSDTNWLYTHSWTINTKWFFTRQIKTSYIDPISWVLSATSTGWLLVRSIVKWVDSGGTNVNEIVLETILTNHK